MADHTDFIRIRGLESADTEVFQGLGGASLTVEGGGGSPETTSTDWLSAFAPADDIAEPFLSFLGAEAPDTGIPDEPEDGSRSLSRSRSLGALVPLVGKIAPWLIKLPPGVVGYGITQIVVNMINQLFNDIEDNIDPTSDRWRLYGIETKLKSIDDHLKTALIWEDGILGIDKSILGTALLRLDDDEKSILRERMTALIAELTNTTGAITTLEQPLKDLSLIDLIIQFGDDLKARIKGKALEF